jgi:hypothetical protein
MAQIESIAQTYLPTVSPYIGAAVGFASPSFGAHIVCIGSLVDQRGNPMAFTTDTPFEIASITKTFTATMYELLVQSGHIGRNDTLGRFIGPEVSSKIQSVPLFDLANYTSGFPADNIDVLNTGTVPTSLTGGYTDAELFAFLANPPFQINPPRDSYHLFEPRLLFARDRLADIANYKGFQFPHRRRGSRTAGTGENSALHHRRRSAFATRFRCAG